MPTVAAEARRGALAAAPFIAGVAPFGIAYAVSDEGFGLATRETAQGRDSAGFQFGANGLLYLTWVAATLAGVILGQLPPDPTSIGLDVIFPLSFLALLLPLIRTPRDAAVAVTAGVAAGAVALRAGKLWAALLARMGLYWGLRALGV